MERLGERPLMSRLRGFRYHHHSCAVAVIPLDDGPGKASASMAHLWVIRDWVGPDHAGDLMALPMEKTMRSARIIHAGLKGRGLSGARGSWGLVRMGSHRFS
jgi:hypothetical protein